MFIIGTCAGSSRMRMGKHLKAQRSTKAMSFIYSLCVLILLLHDAVIHVVSPPSKIFYPTIDNLDPASLPADASREVTVDASLHGAEEGNFKILAF